MNQDIDTTPPPIPDVRVGQEYTYQGMRKGFKDKRVRVIADHWPGSNSPEDAYLVHVARLGSKGEVTQDTWGCDPRWLSPDGKQASPYLEYHNRVSKAVAKMKPVAVTREPFGLADAEDELEQLGLGIQE
jgi:hypothetical protein